MMSSDRYAEAKTPANQPKKIVIPAVVSTYPSPVSFLGMIGNPNDVVIPIWMACSISVILYNSTSMSNHSASKWIHGPWRVKLTCLEFVFDDKNGLNFPFPVFLTTWHLTFSVCPLLYLIVKHSPDWISADWLGYRYSCTSTYDHLGRRC